MTDDEVSLNVRLGDVIAGKYRIERVLGRGAMGVVVAAMHLELGEMRAIKFMNAAAIEEPGAAERFLREAKAAARLKSQHVTRVYDVGRLGSGAPYIVMEYLEGTDLRTKLMASGPLSIDETVLYVVQACEAIGEAHEAGIVHRDIKPGNLFLTRGVGGAPCIKVFDFGIAKLLHLMDGRDLTATSALLGTPKFMSPEQMRAERESIDARSDIWALGVTVHNLLTREVPFDSESLAVLCSAVLWREPRPASAHRADLPAGLDAVIAGCLFKDPVKRYQSTAALAEALLPFASEEVQRAAPRVHVLGASKSFHPVPSGPDPRPHDEPSHGDTVRDDPRPTPRPPAESFQGETVRDERFPTPRPPAESITLLQSADRPLPAALTSSTAGPVATSTTALWSNTTVTRRSSWWSSARKAALVGIGVAAAVTGAIAFLRPRGSPPAPAIRPVETEAPARVAITPGPAVPVPAPALLDGSSAAPVVSALAPVQAAQDAGVARPPGSMTAPRAGELGAAKPAGKGPRPAADPFWSSRR